MRCFSLFLTVLSIAAASPTARAEDESRIGKQIPNFTLRDYHGKEVSLADLADKKLVVVAFLGTDCPLVKLYSARLEELSKKYEASGVTFLGINSNRQDPPTKIGAHARAHGMTFSILKDPDSRVADLFGANRTPEMFVLDSKREVRYWGRIDDQYGLTTGSGYGKPKLTRSDLIDAVDELLAEKPVSVAVTPLSGCIIGRVTKIDPKGDVTYSKHVARIFQDRCVECHRKGEIGPFPLTTYEEVLGWGEMIREVVDQRRMPPWHANPEHGKFVNDRSLSKEEKELIARWVENGQPEGDKADLPEPREFAEGWQIPEPDAVFYISDEPVKVPAEGTVEYKHYTVDTGFTEDKWIKAVEARPENRGVVHHIIVTVIAPGDSEEGSFRRSGGLAGYAPGMQPTNQPDGVGTLIPKGSKLRFQMHYTPNGTATEDRSSVGMVFADPATIKYEDRGGVCGTTAINIPAGASDHVITAKQTLSRDIILTGMMPHTHVRGTSFRYEIDYPDGKHEVLLDVPKFDFNWQLWYNLDKPKLLPKGSVIHTTAHYDNSDDNVFNPDPKINVRYGPQTWEEMMFGWYSTIVPRGDESGGTYGGQE
ncbi:MAG: redoxin domain-containing protein [Pirellulales bacterium]